MIQLLWSAVLAGHAVCGLLWWWLSPSGAAQPVDVWVNQVLPFVPLVLVVLGLATRGKTQEAILPPLFAAYPLFWMTFAISLRLTFPLGAGSWWNLPFIGGFVFALLWMRQYRFKLTAPWLASVFIVPAVWAAWVLPATQRAAEPATTPSNVAMPEPATGSSDPRLIKLSKEAQVHPEDGRIVLRHGEIILTVQPLLTFSDRSPDRGSVASANKEDTLPTVRKLVTFVKEGTHWLLHYKDEDRSVVDVSQHDGLIELDSKSKLGAPIYSHDNHYVEITIRGHKKLSIVLSPIPGKKLEAPSTTAPMRFAYLDAAGRFHVVDASKLNLGPFTEVAAADVPKGKPLELTLFDGDTPLYRIALADFFAQASTQASPSAGDGVPENCIQLVRGGDPDSAAVLITVSLAATPTGRGTRSVGHAAGVYRDRVTITRLAP